MILTLERLVAGLLCWALFVLVVAISIAAGILAAAVMLLAGIVHLLQAAIAALWSSSKGPRNAN
jgi:hypothetical protein